VGSLVRQIVLPVAVAACIVIASGAAAWNVHVAGIAALLDAQAAAARALLASPSGPHDLAGITALIARPEITIAAPPRGMPPPGGPAPGGPPAGPPPGAFPGPPPQANRLAMMVADFAHVPPRVVQTDDGPLQLLPAIEPLASWFAWDVAICALAIAALAVVTWVMGLALARTARRPLMRTTLALEALAAGNFAPQSVEAGDAAELARLARAYNAAAETVARSIEERRSAAAEFQRFLADAGHELRTPLTIVGGYIDILSHAGANDPTARRVIAGMRAETGRMRGLVEKMLLLSRMETEVSAPRAVDVATASEEVAEALRTAFPQRAIDVRCESGAFVCIDEDDLYEAQRNLVENALRYAPDSPVAVRVAARNGMVEVEVTDRGPGIPAAERGMIFERFYRGKERTDAEGSGLGLAIVRRVVERWNGTIDVRCDDAGTHFTMRFPQAPAP
jgi:signal transduction histidine kinase